MKKFWDFLVKPSPNPDERKGFWLLITLVNATLCVPLVLPYFQEKHEFELTTHLSKVEDESIKDLAFYSIEKTETQIELLDSNIKHVTVKESQAIKERVDRRSSNIEEIPIRFNLNSATASELMQVNGIGEVLSARIIKFRDKLGGFHSKEQLYDVYGLEEEVVARLFAMLDDKPLVVWQKVQINTDSFKEVLKHPYLNYENVKVVFNNRPLDSAKICDLFRDKCSSLEPYLEY